ncbi:MAG: response regulator [Pseudomonadota bacterium]
MQNPKILVVDDDIEIRKLLQDLLERSHMRTQTAKSVAEARARLEAERFDLIVLDVMMPEEDGTSFCRQLRQESNVPIIMLSALGDAIDRILGIEMGADDYLPKPFNSRELIVRIKSLLRRAPPLRAGETHQSNQCIIFNEFKLFPETRCLKSETGPIELTSGEFSILLALIEHAPRVLSRDQLLDLSRGASSNPFDRSIDTHISRLRRKLEQDPRRPALIKTVRNFGYAFAAKINRAAK